MRTRRDRMFNEASAKVAYMLGILEGENLIEPFDNWDEVALVCHNIAMDWSDHVDIQDEEEEGYIMRYAERILSEKYPRRAERA
jgi:hypothetical protein